MGVKVRKNKKKINKELKVREELKPVEMDKKSGSSEKKKRKREKEKNGDSRKVVQISTEDSSPKPADNKKKTKKASKGKVKKANNNHGLTGQEDPSNTDGFGELNNDEAVNDEIQLKNQAESRAVMVASEDDRKSKRPNKKRKNLNSLDDIERSLETVQAKPSKKSQKEKGRDMNSSDSKNSLEKKEEANQKDVYLISSEDEGSPKGMKKWLMEYQQNRPGLKVLQQRIDDFIVEHEEKLEQERKEREALSAEEGWQLVTHHKGRKKTRDADGNTVGAVAQAVVESKRAKKKSTDVGLDFYRFQRKEAQRNEIMTLQSKFEQDKKRIQQLRAARKFKPY